jgi:hypothetical protein
MKSFITCPKIIKEIRADERAGPKGLPSHLKSEYGIFDNQRDGWARDPNRIKGRSRSAMLPEIQHQEGSIMKFTNRNKISGSLLHYNKNLNENIFYNSSNINYSFSIHLKHNSQHEIQMQTFSYLSLFESILIDLDQLKQRSLLYSLKMNTNKQIINILAQKYEKVGNINIVGGYTLW